MKKLHSHAPPAQLTLRAHAASLAKVVLVYRTAPERFARAAMALVLCWGAVPLLLWVPPHYPWAAGAMVAGVYLAYRYWTGRYLVCAFSGACPRCGRQLELRLGSFINLPHSMTCFACHFEPRLEVSAETLAEPVRRSPLRLDHADDDCTGRWELVSFGRHRTLLCRPCGARQPAVPALRALAEAENEQGDLLARLTSEGRSLP